MYPTDRVRRAFEALYSESWADTVREARTILRGYSDPADVAATAYTRLWAEVTEGRAEHLHERLMELTRTIAATEVTRGRREEQYLGYEREYVGLHDPDTLDDLYVTTGREGGTHAPDIAAMSLPPLTQDRHHFDVEFDAAVRSLTPKQREAFVLTELRGLSTVEAASTLSITDSAVRHRRLSARKSIANALIEGGAR